MPADSDVTVLESDIDVSIRQLKDGADGPIYLCGGGDFAGQLLELNLIDRIILKRAPIVLGQGVRLFGDVKLAASHRHLGTKVYDSGYVLQEFMLDG